MIAFQYCFLGRRSYCSFRQLPLMTPSGPSQLSHRVVEGQFESGDFAANDPPASQQHKIVPGVCLLDGNEIASSAIEPERTGEGGDIDPRMLRMACRGCCKNQGEVGGCGRAATRRRHDGINRRL
jgi:hypothetical protein